VLLGSAEVSIDAKQRMAIPAKHRQQLNAEVNGSSLVCVPSVRGGDEAGGVGAGSGGSGVAGAGVLKLYPMKKFAELCAAYEESATADADVETWEAAFYGRAEEIEMDGAGRLTLPKALLEKVGLVGEELVIVGAGNRLELRAKREWEATLAKTEPRMGDLNRRIEGRRRGV